MSSDKRLHVGFAPKAMIAALCLALAMVSFTACSSKPSTDGGSSAPSSQAEPVDFSSWKTYGDAMAAKTEDMASGWDDNYYVSMFKVGDSIVRVVAKVEGEGAAAIDAVDWSTDNVAQQIDEAAGPLELVSVEDVTDQLLSDEEIAGLVGKTGQELIDEGWEFQSYFMYGGEQTGAEFAKDYLTYMLTFDVSITDNDSEDGGASVMDAPIVEAMFSGAANSATDPTSIE